MSGVGQRFIDAGYKDPKPLIEIDGKPVIEHVVNLFPDENNFIFICNSIHLRETNMRSILERIAPKCKILEIDPHKKGPVYAVTKILNYINDNDEVIVNYCDFSTYWNYHDFLDHTRKRKADGAIAAYKGFHPHMLGTTNYAFMRDDNQWMLEIKEKEPFTNNRMMEYASNGTYYFKSGEILKKYFNQTIKMDLNIKGEYYVSLVYNLLLRDNLKISIYEIQHMLQWGTPQDLEEYNMWSKYFVDMVMKKNVKSKKYNFNVVVPMAGKGNRFSKEGYTTPKPLIHISGLPMVLQAVRSLPIGTNYHFVCQKEHLADGNIKEVLYSNFDNAHIEEIDYVTNGQACTAELGVNKIENDHSIIIGACDNGMVWDTKIFDEILASKPDIIVWSFRNYPGGNRSPEMYGWTKSSNGQVCKVSVKKRISRDPRDDHGIVGTFYFKNKTTYMDCLQYLYDHEIKINNEYYIDSMLEAGLRLGMNIKSFVIDYYLCWGTPNDLKTFNYWQSFFHKCKWHPYKLEKDSTVSHESLHEFIAKNSNFKQKYEV